MTHSSRRLSSADILKTLIGFDTVSRNSNLDLLAWIEGYLDDHGISSRRVYDGTGTKANLWATIGPDGPGGVILSGHTDVVPVDGQDWSSDPFVMEDRDGRLYGRGACDMKGFLACVLAAVPDMVAADSATPIHLAFSYDEEVGCIGVRTLLKALQDDGAAPAACIVGEPTSMQVVIGHKGKRSMIAEVTGKEAHSSLAPTGVNAVDYGARLVLKIREIAERLAHEGGRDPLYDVPFSTGHTGVMTGGTALNIVPNHCHIEFEFRTIAADDPDALVDEVRAYAERDLVPAMQAVDPATGIGFALRSGIPGLETPPDDPLVTLAKRLAGRNDHGKVAFGTEGGLFTDWLGVPTVVCGPGSIEQAHKPDEYVESEQLTACDAFITRLITHLGEFGHLRKVA